MRATSLVAMWMGLAGCAMTGGGKYPPNAAICLPCVQPCTPDSSCKAAPAAPARVAVTKERLELKEKVFFDTGQATIKPVSFSLLDEVATVLKAHAELKRTEIEGHTDSQGDAELNKTLSQQRAEAVRAYLVNKGVDASRLGAKGFGAEKPVGSNETEEGREANRRVEFRIAE